MENQYGIAVTNKFDLFLDEDVDPLELLQQKQEEAAKKKDVKKEPEGKKSKNKSGKKAVLQPETKNKPAEPIVPKKEEKVNAPRQNDRPRTGGRPPREQRDRDDNDRRPPRRRGGDENFNPDSNRGDRFEGGFGRSERGGGFGRSDRSERSEGGFGGDRGERGEGSTFGRDREGGGGFNRERGEGGGFGRGGGRGGRGGSRGIRRDRGGGRGGGGFGKREFERHSGSDRTGVKATEKREGGGAHNWGTIRDDLDPPPKVDYWRDPKEQMKEPEETPDWNAQVEDTENQDPNESTESGGVNEEDNQPKQMTLDEWKKSQEAKRNKPQYNIRKPGEGVDKGQWKQGREYRKSEGDEEEEDEEEEEEEEYHDDHKHTITSEFRITFNDSPRRGRGGRRARGPRAGMSRGGGGFDRRGGRQAAPKFDDETDFPRLVKTEA